MHIRTQNAERCQPIKKRGLHLKIHVGITNEAQVKSREEKGVGSNASAMQPPHLVLLWASIRKNEQNGFAGGMRRRWPEVLLFFASTRTDFTADTNWMRCLFFLQDRTV